MAVHVVDHPLVRHKLGILRKESTSTSEFRMLAKEIARLLMYEAIRCKAGPGPWKWRSFPARW